MQNYLLPAQSAGSLFRVIPKMDFTYFFENYSRYRAALECDSISPYLTSRQKKRRYPRAVAIMGYATRALIFRQLPAPVLQSQTHTVALEDKRSSGSRGRS